MSKLSKKAVLSVLSLVLTFVALGATTFAWFSLGNTATVNPFDVEVRGTEGLEIALISDTIDTNSPYHKDNARWYSGISSDNFYAYVAHLVEAANTELDNHDEKFVMDAVTSGDGVNFKKFNTINDGAIELENATANKDYLSFTFLLRTSTNKNINLEELNVNSTRKTDIDVWKSDIEEEFYLASGKKVTHDNEVNLELADALRISFKEETDNDTVIFEKKAGEGDVANTEGVMTSSFEIEEEVQSPIENYQYGAFAYFAFKEGYKGSNEENIDEITLQPDVDFDKRQYAEAKNFGEVLEKDDFVITNDNAEGNEQIYELTVNVWFEGYDNEAFNALLEQFVTIDMKFALVDETETTEG